MRRILFLIAFIAIVLPSSGCVFYKPDFKGQILDIDTKQPIEEAVVVAVYRKRMMGLGAGTVDSIINVRESLTNKEGKFDIPSYTTMITPFSWAIDTDFIIFKPGYASLEMGLEKEFSGIANTNREVQTIRNMKVKFRIMGAIVEMPAIKTREERLIAEEVGVTDYKSKELPLLYRILNIEERHLGIPERK